MIYILKTTWQQKNLFFILTTSLSICFFYVWKWSISLCLETAHTMFVCFLIFFYGRRNPTTKWSSLIFLMEGPLSWLPDLVSKDRPLELKALGLNHASHNASIYFTCSHTHIRVLVQFHRRNYQSAPQPPNWGIYLNSVKWHFSDRGSSRARLRIKVIPRDQGGCVWVQEVEFSIIHSSERGWGLGPVNKTITKTGLGLLLMLLLSCQTRIDWQPATENDSQTNPFT